MWRWHQVRLPAPSFIFVRPHRTDRWQRLSTQTWHAVRKLVLSSVDQRGFTRQLFAEQDKSTTDWVGFLKMFYQKLRRPFIALLVRSENSNDSRNNTSFYGKKANTFRGYRTSFSHVKSTKVQWTCKWRVNGRHSSRPARSNSIGQLLSFYCNF